MITNRVIPTDSFWKAMNENLQSVIEENNLELQEAKKAIQRVRELHVRISRPNGIAECGHCEETWGYLTQADWPCDTIKALDGEQ